MGNGIVMPSRVYRSCSRLMNSCLSRYWSTYSRARRITVKLMLERQLQEPTRGDDDVNHV